MSQTTTSQSAEQVPAPGHRFGTLVESQRAAIEATLRAAYGSPAAAEARRFEVVAGAYASGWRTGRREVLGEDYARVIDLAERFAVEYAWAAYAYDTGASHVREGYARAWEQALRANGLTP